MKLTLPDVETMPRERYVHLLGIAAQLWAVAWLAEGNKGSAPPLATLSLRNKKRWFGAALASDALTAEALQDKTHAYTVINSCIAALEALKAPVKIK